MKQESSSGKFNGKVLQESSRKVIGCGELAGKREDNLCTSKGYPKKRRIDERGYKMGTLTEGV